MSWLGPNRLLVLAGSSSSPAGNLATTSATPLAGVPHTHADSMLVELQLVWPEHSPEQDGIPHSGMQVRGGG